MLNKVYELTHDNDGWAFIEILKSQGIPHHRGVMFQVIGIERKPIQDKLFVTDILVNGVRCNIGSKHAGYFAIDMVKEMIKVGIMKEYEVNLKGKVVHNSAGIVGQSHCETEYLMQGKNGGRLMESVNRIRQNDSAKAYLNEYGTIPLEERYNAWVLENIHVYELFCKYTLQAIESGKKRISHWLIVNRLRWEVEIETKGLCDQDKEYKISNDYIAFLARDFIKDHPEHASIFKLKNMKRI